LFLGFCLGFSVSSFIEQETESSPQDWIDGDSCYGLYNIKGKDYTLKMENIESSLFLTDVLPTGSMKPVLNGDSTVIYKKIDSVEFVDLGDIVIFGTEDQLIGHGVIEKDMDEKGLFLITKGDNNRVDDTFTFGKIRDEDIRGVVIGIIY
jgi:signal peptidase I